MKEFEDLLTKLKDKASDKGSYIFIPDIKSFYPNTIFKGDILTILNKTTKRKKWKGEIEKYGKRF